MPKFHYYAIANGIATLFRRFGKWAHSTIADTAPKAPKLPFVSSA
jgi:hypothetical protein